MLIAQITDSHIVEAGTLYCGRHDTGADLERVVIRLNGLSPRPDIVIHTGDVTENGTDAEYRRFRDITAGLEMPVYCIPGNHDRRDAMRRALCGDYPLAPNSDFLQFSLDIGPIRLIALDTLDPNSHAGELCDLRLSWLAGELANARGRPVVIAMHHPPFPIGIGHIDAIQCRNHSALAELVHLHSNIEAIICGHAHRPVSRRWAGAVASICPSVTHQFAFNLAQPKASGFIFEPPALQLHYWLPDGWAAAGDIGAGLVSHTIPVEDFGPAYHFRSGLPVA